MKQLVSNRLLLILVMLMALSGCAKQYLDETGQPYSKQVSSTAKYLAMESKLADTKLNINQACQTISKGICLKARKYFNVASDVYIIAGEYYKSWNDPDNNAKYIETAFRKIEEMQRQNYQDENISAAILAVGQIVVAAKGPYEQRLESIIMILDTQLLDIIAALLTEGR